MLKRNSRLTKFVGNKKTTKTTTKKTTRKDEKSDTLNVKIIKSKAEFMKLYPNIKIK